MLSDHQISALCPAGTKSKSSWCNSKENNEFTLQQNIPRQLRKSKSKRPLNQKPDGLRQTFFLVLQKDGREGFAGIQILLKQHQIRIPN
jgi:hypothetical protein